jgi:hypothetical protein
MKWLGAFLAVLVIAYAALHFSYPAGFWRYRLTLEVETPEGTKTGSSVYQIGVSTGMKIGDSSGAGMFAKGEALQVDLGARGVLFALMTKDQSVDYNGYLVFKAFPYPGSKTGPLSGVATPEGLKYYASLRAKSNVPQSQLPSLVRFRDLNNPKSVELVDANDLAKSFGVGVTLKSATIEMVDQGYWPLNQMGLTGEPITRGIENRLPWLATEEMLNSFWKSFYALGFRPNGSVEVLTLFKRG